MSGALGGIGTAVGTAFGGPLGGMAGGMIGNALGGGSGGTGLSNAFQGPQGQNPVNYGMGQQANSIYQNTLGDYQNLYKSYDGGANSNYVQSQVNPAIQSNATQYGNLMNDQANRGIRGSSFGDQSLSNFTNAANTNVANTQAQAMQNQFGMQNNLLQGMTGIGNQYNNQGIAGMQGQISNQNLLAQNNLAAQKQNAGMLGGLFSGALGMGGNSALGSGTGLGGFSSGIDSLLNGGVNSSAMYANNNWLAS